MESFQKAYCDFVARLGNKSNSFVWWSTWIASKNRFLSPLTPSLERFWLYNVEPEMSLYKFFGICCFNLLRLAKFLAWVLPRWIGSVILLHGQKKYFLETEKGKDFVLIKTFAYPHSFPAGGFKDVFFGRLPEHFKSQGASVVTVIDPLLCWKQAWKFCQNNKGYYPYLSFVTVADFFSAASSLFAEFIRAGYTDCNFKGADLSTYCTRLYRTQLLEPGAFHALLFHASFSRIASLKKWKLFLLTSENNPWERMVIAAIRKKSPDTSIRGYQHTIVSEASLNMFPGEGEFKSAPHPDILLTVGEEPAKILTRSGGFSEDFPITPACAVRFEYLQKFLQASGHEPKKPPKRLLIAFEAAPDTYRLLDFVVKNYNYLQDWEVRVRCHPAMPYPEIKNRLRENTDHLSHFSLSKATDLAEDLGWAGVVLYWGSTVSMEALAVGLPVIHLDLGQSLSYDPLLLCQHYHWTTREQDVLGDSLDEILSLTPTERAQRHSAALGYLKNYFWPVTLENLQKFSKE